MGTEEGKNRFLSDKPINSVDEDEFRHKEYVDTLEQMVKEAEPPWNIGVFGEWGSGKTSIIHMLYSRLRNSDNGYVCVEFDAWKHAEESIRTDLLLNLDQAIGEKTGQEVDGEPGVLGEESITRELYDVQEEQDDEDLSAWEEAERIYTESPLVGRLILLILGVIVVGAIANLLTIIGVLPISDPTLSSMNSILSAFLFPLFVSVFVFMAGEVRAATTALRRKHPRKEWSGAYEQLFQEITEGTDADKILISVDNLDRCESETVYDVLVSLKTFLENKRCIYIIPCDDQALQSHIESIDKQGGYFGDGENGGEFEIRQNEREFLRKFFQTHIRIPPFIAEDIEEYAEAKNQNLADPFDSGVLDVITKAYVKNPRRIKQSLNQLTTLRILAEQMEEEGHLEPGRLTKNMDFLAKIMVLKEDYQSFYSELQDNPRLLEDVNDYFRGDITSRERENRIEGLLGKESGASGGESQLEKFLRSTRRCMVENPQPFLQLGEPSFASELGDHEAFLQDLRTNQEDDIRAELETVQQGEKSLDPYLQAIDDRLDDYTAEARYNPLFSTIDTLISVFDELEEENQERVSEVLSGYLTLDSVQDFFADFDPDEFFPVLLQMKGEDQDTVFQRYAKVVVSEDGFRESVLSAFVENAANVPDQAAEQLCDSLGRLDGAELKEVAEILSSTEESKKLATPDLLEKMAQFANWKDNQFTETEYYTRFDSQAEPRARQYFVDRLFDVEKQVQKDQDNNAENQYYKRLQQNLSNLDGQVTRKTGNALFDKLKQRVSSQGGQPTQFVKVVINFYDSYDAGKREEFLEWIANLLERWNQNSIQQIINHSRKQDVEILEDEAVVEAVLSRIPDDLNNSSFIVGTLIPAIPAEYDEQVLELVRRLSKENNHSQNLIAAEIFTEYPERFKEVQDSVLERCRNQVNSADNADRKRTYLRAEAVVYEDLSDAEKEGLINRLDSLLSGDQSEHQAYQNVWEDIEDKVESERRTTVARNLQRQLRSEIRGNIQPNQLFPLLDVFIALAETDDVDEDDGERTVERLTDQFEGSNLNNRQLSSLVEKVAEFPRYYGREEQTLTRAENLINKNSDNRVYNNAQDLLKALEESGDFSEDRIENIEEKINK